MPLGEFIDEVKRLFRQQPTPDEFLVHFQQAVYMKKGAPLGPLFRGPGAASPSEFPILDRGCRPSPIRAAGWLERPRVRSSTQGQRAVADQHMGQ